MNTFGRVNGDLSPDSKEIKIRNSENLNLPNTNKYSQQPDHNFDPLTPLNLSLQRASNQLSFMHLSMEHQNFQISGASGPNSTITENDPFPAPNSQICILNFEEKSIPIDLSILELLLTQFEKSFNKRKLKSAKIFLLEEIEKRLVMCRNYIHIRNDLERVVHCLNGEPGELVEGHVLDLEKGEEYSGELRDDKYQGKGTKIVMGYYTLSGHFETGKAYGHGEKRYSPNEFYM